MYYHLIRQCLPKINSRYNYIKTINSDTIYPFYKFE